METESINDTESINNILKKKDKTYSISLKNYEKNTHLKVKTDELVNKIRTNLNTLKRLEKDRWDGYNNALKFEKYTQRKEFAE